MKESGLPSASCPVAAKIKEKLKQTFN